MTLIRALCLQPVKALRPLLVHCLMFTVCWRLCNLSQWPLNRLALVFGCFCLLVFHISATILLNSLSSWFSPQEYYSPLLSSNLLRLSLPPALMLKLHLQGCYLTVLRWLFGHVFLFSQWELIWISTSYIPGLSLFDLERIRRCCISFALYKCFYSISFFFW